MQYILATLRQCCLSFDLHQKHSIERKVIQTEIYLFWNTFHGLVTSNVQCFLKNKSGVKVKEKQSLSWNKNRINILYFHYHCIVTWSKCCPFLVFKAALQLLNVISWSYQTVVAVLIFALDPTLLVIFIKILIVLIFLWKWKFSSQQNCPNIA